MSKRRAGVRHGFRGRLGGVSFLLATSLLLALASGFATTSVLTASATVPTSNLVKNTRPVGAADLRPSDCAALTLTGIVAGSGTITATTGGQLVLASPGSDTISVAGGNECVVGGAGADSVTVQNGTAVCVISAASTQSGCTTVVRRP